MEKEVKQVSEMLNSFSFNPQKFCEEMTKEHKTLQQSFTRLCMHWISTCADDSYKYDGRNAASHTVCKAIVDSCGADFIGTYSLPFI